MGRSRSLEVHEPRRKKRVACYTCTKCRYSSNRYYNILRHERRIHTVPKRQPQCCDVKFESKADYYVHCEAFHPGKRSNLTSQKKYGIRAESPMTESIVKHEASVPKSEQYPEIKYMLRSRVRPKGTAVVCYAEDSDPEESSTKRAEETSGYGSTSLWSSLEAQDHNRSSDLDYTSNDDESSVDDFHSDRNESSIDDYHSDRNESSRIDSLFDHNASSGDDAKPEIDKTRMAIDEKPVSVNAKTNPCENFDLDRSYYSNKENVSPLENELNPLGSSSSDYEERKIVSVPNTDLTKRSFDSGVPITSTPEILPLKKRILRDLAIENRENIMQSRKSVGDRLCRRPTTKSSKLLSIYDDAENMPPIVSINYSCKNRVLGKELRNRVTARHREFLSSIDFDLFYNLQ